MSESKVVPPGVKKFDHNYPDETLIFLEHPLEPIPEKFAGRFGVGTTPFPILKDVREGEVEDFQLDRIEIRKVAIYAKVKK